MSKYRKKPVIIEAWQFTEETKDQVYNNVTCTCYAAFDEKGKPALIIQTLEGEMVAHLGDYVIKGGKGRVLPLQG